MKKITGSLALFVFLSPFIFGLGSIIFYTLKAIVENIEAVLWISGVSLIFILWGLSGHYGFKYLNSATGTNND